MLYLPLNATQHIDPENQTADYEDIFCYDEKEHL